MSSRDELVARLQEECCVDLPLPAKSDGWSDDDVVRFYQSGGILVPDSSEGSDSEEGGVASKKVQKQYEAVDAATFKKWFPKAKRVPSPSMRVICFAPAGCAESVFSMALNARPPRPSLLVEWGVQNNVEVLCVELPGRMIRGKEACLTTCREVAREVVAVVGSFIGDGTPYAVMGHSVGTWNSFEFISLLRDEGFPPPCRGIFSNFPAPDIDPATRPWNANRGMPEKAFKNECRGWDVNEVVFSAGMWPSYQGILRGDFTLFDEYEFVRGGDDPFPFPLTLFYGTNDKRVKESHVREWLRFTAVPEESTVAAIKGNHLFVFDAAGCKAWMEGATKALAYDLQNPRTPGSGSDGQNGLKEAVVRWAFNTGDWDPSPAEWDAALALLPPEEQKACTRFHFMKDRKLAMGSRLLQRKLVEEKLGIPFKEVEIARTHEGKPYLVNSGRQARAMGAYPNWNFNVSHHGSVVAIIAEPTCLAGLDVMDLKDRPKSGAGSEEFFRSFSTNFTKNEWKAIRAGKTQEELFANFYRFWAAKEAYIKAVGIGLGFDLMRAEFTFAAGGPGDVSLKLDGAEAPAWRLHAQDWDGHVLCTARGPPDAAHPGYKETLPCSHLPAAVLEEGLSLPNPPFRRVTFQDLQPRR